MTGNGPILVVDDCPNIRTVFSRVLEREGYRVIACAGGKEALAAMNRERPALVLLDVEMPGLDGRDLLTRIRRHQRLADLHVILVTGRSGQDARLHGLELGADDYIEKPVQPWWLLRAVRSALGVHEPAPAP